MIRTTWTPLTSPAPKNEQRAFARRAVTHGPDANDEDGLRVIERLGHAAALAASEDASPPTEEELEDEAALDGFIVALMALTDSPNGGDR